MSTNENTKTIVGIVVLAAVSIISYTIIMTFAVLSIKELSFDSFRLDDMLEKHNNVQSIRLSFEKIKRINDNLFSQIVDMERIDDLEKEISENTDFIEETIKHCLVYSMSVEESISIRNLLDLMTEHKYALKQMIKFAKNNDKNAMGIIFLDTDLLQQNIDTKLQELSDNEQSFLEERRFFYEYRSHRAISPLFIITSIAIIISSIIAGLCILLVVKSSHRMSKNTTNYGRY